MATEISWDMRHYQRYYISIYRYIWRQIIVVFSYRFGEYNVKMCSGNGVVKLAGRIRHMRTWVSEADIKGMDK